MEGTRAGVSNELLQANRERMKDRLFEQLIAGKVLEAFSDDLSEADFPEEAIVEMEKEFSQLSEEHKRAVLAIPKQLRQPVFRKYAKLIHSGEMTGQDVLRDILAKAMEYGFTLGFHVSLYDIRPEQDGSWYVRGTEKDHRHNDMPMAYYSTDFSNRYKDKRTKYLYIIRAETGEKTSHYRDNDGSWGHASSLSIIEKLELESLERELAQRIRQAEERSQKKLEDA